MTRHILRIDPDGTLRTLWTDAIPLAELGDLTVTRASFVEFDEIHQEWTVQIMGRNRPPPTAYRSPSRIACLAWEAEFFNRQLETT